MAKSKLEEAMKPTRYTHHQPPKPSQHTGKAQEEPAKPARPMQPASSPQDPRKPFTRVVTTSERTAFRRPRPTRVTTQDDFNEAQFDAEPETRSQSKLPPDPFPLQYRDGDPDFEFECE